MANILSFLFYSTCIETASLSRAKWTLKLLRYQETYTFKRKTINVQICYEVISDHNFGHERSILNTFYISGSSPSLAKRWTLTLQVEFGTYSVAMGKNSYFALQLVRYSFELLILWSFFSLFDRRNTQNISKTTKNANYLNVVQRNWSSIDTKANCESLDWKDTTKIMYFQILYLLIPYNLWP